MDSHQLTFFTCGDIDPWKSFEHLETILKSEFSESIEIPRGLTSKIQKHSQRGVRINYT